VLARLGIHLFEVREAGCCGAVRLHLNDADGARADARRNIDAWWPHLASGSEAIVITASGCGVQVKDYGHLLQDDPAYAAKATRIAELTRDVSEVVAAEMAVLRAVLEKSALAGRQRLAFHAPCTLQHGLKLKGGVEQILAAAGFELTPVADSHLCCGSAGTYSILQPEIAHQLRDNKLAALLGNSATGKPDGIASANIGCIAHLQSDTRFPVKHWIEWLDEKLSFQG
jgi:glycolate oxidase iron-sulfur subunit